ncbi:MAG TPA: hypothetical protein VMV69_02365 [Pirellulales bacterium]|nr:hypothetical protein [Pirellulales bacterium]
MREPPKVIDDVLVAEFRHEMLAFRKLLKLGLRECQPELSTETQRQLRKFMRGMEQGILIKVFVEIALIDGPLTAPELSLASELFEHISGEKPEPRQRETLDSLTRD